MTREKHQHGFMVIEMFFVFAIIVVLVTITAYFFAEPGSQSRDNRRISDLKQISHALLLYADAKGGYPKECDFSTDQCWGTFVDQYITKVPVDPVNRNTGSCESSEGCLVYRYCRLDGGARFVVSANLENPPKIPLGNHQECSLGGPNQHWVTN